MLTVMLSFYYPNFKNDLLNIKSHSYTSIHKAMCQEKIKRHKKYRCKSGMPKCPFTMKYILRAEGEWLWHCYTQVEELYYMQIYNQVKV